MSALTTNSNSLSGAILSPANEQRSKAAQNVAVILWGLALGDVVLEDGYRADLHNRRQKQLGRSGHTGRYKPLHVHCKENTLQLWVGERPHISWVRFDLDGGRLVYEDSVVCDGDCEWRLKGQENAITNYWRQAGYGNTQWTRVQVLS